MQILKVIELKENEYYQILIFIQGVFSKLNIISMAIIVFCICFEETYLFFIYLEYIVKLYLFILCKILEYSRSFII